MGIGFLWVILAAAGRCLIGENDSILWEAARKQRIWRPDRQIDVIVRIAAFTLAPLVLFAACSDDPHPPSETPRTELSADQILGKLLIATRDIRSFQLETRSTIRPGQDYWWTEYFWLRDGPDHYLALTFGEDPDASEESLFYRGIPYRRAPSGGWTSSVPDHWDAHDQEASSDFTRSDRDDSERALMIYGIKIQFISGLKRLPDETLKGATMLRLQGDYRDWTSFPASALWPDEVEPSEDTDIDVEGVGTIDLWVDSQTFRITKAEIVLAPVDEATEARAYTSLLYAQFNEAELPGPLP